MLDARMLDCFINLGGEKTATKSIMVFNIRSSQIEASNSIAKDYFKRSGDEVVFSDLFEFKEEGRNALRLAMNSLTSRDEVILTNRMVVTKEGMQLKSDIKFMYLTPERDQLLITIKPEIDNRRYYLERFIDSRRRPALTYDINNLKVDYANILFYRAFACDKVRIVTMYDSRLTNFMREDYRADFENTIKDSVHSIDSMLLDIPFSTSNGKTLNLYYNTKTLKDVTERDSGLIYFCLAEKHESVKALCDPFE
ncbi:MAG: hypothetical protein R3Y07_06860 [Eubacteriales bacterium]